MLIPGEEKALGEVAALGSCCEISTWAFSPSLGSDTQWWSMEEECAHLLLQVSRQVCGMAVHSKHADTVHSQGRLGWPRPSDTVPASVVGMSHGTLPIPTGAAINMFSIPSPPQAGSCQSLHSWPETPLASSRV